MAVIPFGEWAPDASDFGNPGSLTVKNVLPGRNSYKPFPSLSVLSDALDNRPLGAIEAFDKDGTSHQYAGDSGKLYELDSDLLWQDRSKTGGYSTASGEIWEFVRWDNKVLATNFSDNPQQITMGGSAFSDLTTDFTARHIAVIGDFVVAGNTNDTSDGNVPNRVRWSAIGDETDWTVSTSTLSDFRDLTTGGPIQAITGGDVAIIVSERSVFRMTFVGAPVVFQIDEILPGVGTPVPTSVTRLGESVYFLSERGFVQVTGGGSGVNYIGDGRVDEFFRMDFNRNFEDRMSVVSDPTTNSIAWLYPGADSDNGTPNRMVIYNVTFDRWVYIEQEAELVVRAIGTGITLDELDSLGFDNLDTMTVSLDSQQFIGGATQFAAFDPDNKLGFFRAANKTATVETKERELNGGQVTHLNAFRPIVDSGTVTARVGSRDRQTDTVTYTNSLTQSNSGRFTKRVKGKYHRFELTISGDWEDAIGVQVLPEEARPGGTRARS